jgi:hypothetical protein
VITVDTKRLINLANLQKNCGTAIDIRGTEGSERLLNKLKKLEKKK